MPAFQVTNGRRCRVVVSQTRLTSSAAATASPASAVLDERRLDDLDAGLSQAFDAAGRGMPGIPDRDHHPHDTGGQQRLGAGTRSSGVIARLEGDHGRRAAGPVARRGDRRHLGVRPAGTLVIPLADGPAAGRQQHAADHRIGQHRARTEVGQVRGAPQRGYFLRPEGRNGHRPSLRPARRGCDAAHPWRRKRKEICGIHRRTTRLCLSVSANDSERMSSEPTTITPAPDRAGSARPPGSCSRPRSPSSPGRRRSSSFDLSDMTSRPAR